ncbi:methionyl-tRNA formyltransferase [Arcanobacterium bovis]|uniref:Methionyl-tRNA formyltransferase n=1 Tax=Arcanobacterium bovis TaxID=2529275 RepID=A0A4Q9V1G0_9ACTO|nr:methionyl-tRNA formyltransferase [Arcanobacterium bovis]TBW22921.1 methionyl-tRNA formyltransferase [Arcanobacterium bovis]
MRILFAGTPDTAVPSLEKLHSEHEVLAVLTRAPAKVGRKRELRKSAVHEAAEELGLPVYTPASLKDEQVEEMLANYAPDAIAVVAYGLLIPKKLLELPRLGWFNLHFSLLPRWRGASPVQAALAAGDESTGTTIFKIDAGLDTGPIVASKERPIPPAANAQDLLEILAQEGAQHLAEVFAQLAQGDVSLYEQVGEPSYAGLLRARDGEINWHRTAIEIYNQIRGMNPEPGTWSTLGGQRIKILGATISESAIEPGVIVPGKVVRVGTATKALELDIVAPAGKRPMDAQAWGRGLKGDRLEFDAYSQIEE